MKRILRDTEDGPISILMKEYDSDKIANNLHKQIDEFVVGFKKLDFT